ncbi:spondin-2 [Lingula anatina]|uniref:Spondin-2 n=1 Tax=Lingula anatina TaxID=7574 RepID=A0A1S3J1D4_LINAN|nr:spondin-2 [Lingula anatina]|eukprot:XP_013404257.1 spondin-2 [Lingula anatina]
MNLSLYLLLLAVFAAVAYAATSCNAPGLARYVVQYRGEWTKAKFPKMFPLRRPYGPASWSKMMGRSHDSTYSMWHLGQFANNGLKQFAKSGATAILDQDPQGQKGIFDVFTGPRLPAGTGVSRTSFFVDGKHPSVSIVIRMIPSPDWFVGVDSLDLCEGDQWKDKVTIQLNPIDAGVDKGLTFTSPDWPSKEKISEITSKSPSHPASPFYYPKLNKLPRIGTLTFEKAPIDISDVDNLSDLLDDNDYVEEEGTSTPIDCEVADWGKWGPCQGKCKTGRKIRYRVVVQPAMNGGAECPTLSDEA